MFRLLRNKKGFTLMEILLVVLFLSVIGTFAVTSYFNSSKDFQFLENYKNLTSSIREARSNSITNKEINDALPMGYGLQLEAKKITLFADTDGLDFAFDAVNDILISEYDFSDTPHELSAIDPETYVPLALPMVLFYQTGTYGGMVVQNVDGTLYAGDGTVNDDMTTVIQFTDTERETERFVVIINFSGIPEEVLKYPEVVANAQVINFAISNMLQLLNP